jgi:hypothetical protein
MGILSFLGGTAFRWLFGEIIGFVKEREERKRELEMMRLSHEQDKDKHQWQQEAIAAQAAAGVRVIEARRQADESAASDATFFKASEGVNKASERGDWIGAWNASIRPFLATVGILLLVGNTVAPSVFVLSALVMELICAALGVFVGERIRQRGN